MTTELSNAAPGDVPTQKDRLIVKSGGKEKIVLFSNIPVVQGAGNYSEINHAGDESLLDDRSLNQLEAELPEFSSHSSILYR